MLKRLISLLLVTLMIFSSFSIGFVNASAADDTMTKLVSLIKKFPHGKYWNHTGKNNPDGVTSSPCSCHNGRCDYFGGCNCNSYGSAIQCMGYAAKVSYDITGVDRYEYEETYTLDVSKLRVGDIIRSNSHSVCVTGVNGDKISITHCNYAGNCIIRWETVTKSWFGNRIEYVLHLKGNERTNTNVDFHKAYGGDTTDPETPTNPPVTEPDEEITNAEIWKMDDESSLNIRNGKSTSASKIGSVSAGEKFYVFEKEISDGYLWAEVKYNGLSGYSVLNYAEYISGKYETPELKELKKAYNSASGVSLEWNTVSGADKYVITIYDEKSKVAGTYESTSNSYTVKKLKAGKYSVGITAKSSLAPSWNVAGEKKSFSVTQETVAVKSISLRKTGHVQAGTSAPFYPTVLPENATNQELIWTSSNTKVATINNEGVVTGVAPGKAVIKCTSKENSNIFAVCDFTVTPSAITTIQVAAGTTGSTIGLRWTVSKGATGYLVYRYNPSTKAYIKLANVNTTAYIDKNLRPSTEYIYAVRPYAIVDKTVLLASFKAITAKTTPSAVSVIRQSGSDTGRVAIQWEKKANADVYSVLKYDVQTRKFRRIAITTATSYIDTDKPATKVYYSIIPAVKTADGYALGPASAIFTAITGLDKPTVRTAVRGNAIGFVWSKVNLATHYQVFKVVNGKKVLVKTVTSATTSFIEQNLKNNQTYTYYVRAVRLHRAGLYLFSSEVPITVKTAK